MEDVKKWLRNFLGLDSVPSLEMFKAMEMKQRERHDELTSLISQVIKQKDARPAREPFSSPVLDWDTVQAMVLAQMEKETPPNEAVIP